MALEKSAVLNGARELHFEGKPITFRGIRDALIRWGQPCDECELHAVLAQLQRDGSLLNPGRFGEDPVYKLSPEARYEATPRRSS
jgi:hypothetical protein